jgi:hypothetical protein
VIRIDALWVPVQPMDMRAGADRLLAHVVKVLRRLTVAIVGSPGGGTCWTFPDRNRGSHLHATHAPAQDGVPGRLRSSRQGTGVTGPERRRTSHPAGSARRPAWQPDRPAVGREMTWGSPRMRDFVRNSDHPAGARPDCTTRRLQRVAGAHGGADQRHRAQLRRPARARQVRLRRDRELPPRHVLQAVAGDRTAAVERDAAPAPGCASGRLVRLCAGADRDAAGQRPA